MNLRNNTNNLLTTIPNTLGLSLIGTTVAVGFHHLWRKRTNPTAKLSDYLTGTAETFQRIEQANSQAWKTWQTTFYKTSYQTSDKNSHKKNHQSHQKNSHQECQPNTPSNPKPQTHLVEWVSGVANKTNSAGDFDDFSVVGIDKNRQIVWQTNIPERVHDIVVQPESPPSLPLMGRNSPPLGRGWGRARHVAVMGRRPSEYFWIMDSATGETLHTIKSEGLQKEDNRHFYGHACYSLDGGLLYVAENNTDTFGGIIGVYEVVNAYQKINEFSTYGIGPHELIMHPDGDKLIIANGGIKTERASREELNIESMQPSLVYLSLINNEEGKVLQQIEPKENQMSVRHVSAVTPSKSPLSGGESIANKGTIAIGIQFQGERHLNVPLVLTHKFGDDDFTEYTMNNSDDVNDDINDDINDGNNNKQASWRQFHHYIASVLVNSTSNLICATSPIGGCVSIFDMASQSLIDTVKIADCAGIAVASHNNQDGFLVSDGQGGLTLLTVVDGKLATDKVSLPMAFDNHMQVVK